MSQPIEATDSKYNRREFMGVKIDIYRLLDLFEVSHPAHQHAVKKLIRAGQSVKSLEQDTREVVEAINRWAEMIREDRMQLEYDWNQSAQKASHAETPTDD